MQPRRFRRHFSHTWLDLGGPEGDLMELSGWSAPQGLRRYGASVGACLAWSARGEVKGELPRVFRTAAGVALRDAVPA